MTMDEIASLAMLFVEQHWDYYDEDWGRARCRFCGNSSTGYERGEIAHRDDCGYKRLTNAYAEELLKKQFLVKLEKDYDY